MYARPVQVTEEWIQQKFAKHGPILTANLAAFHAGYNFGETTELLDVQYHVKPAALRPGTYRNVDGTTATALGLIAASVTSGLPMVIIDVQRAGPSTGMPTKPESSDLLMALYGRHGESPLPVIAAATPAHCFDAALEAVRLAVDYRTPVILLSDAFLASSSEPWLIP